MAIPSPDFTSLPPSLQTPTEALWQRVFETLPEDVLLQTPREILGSFPLVLASSPFIAHEITRDDLLFRTLISEGLLLKTREHDEILSVLAQALTGIEEEEGLMRVLRKVRNLEMVRIAWRDIAGWARLEETLKDLSLLAEAAVESALNALFKGASERFGVPHNREGEPQNLVVLGMGKLGARELNFSSDIDLILAYRDDGVLPDRKETSYAEFYARLARNLVRVLGEHTADGFVFRVDTRLRPFGDSGPIVLHFDALERYYEGQAREWERYAMIKARAIAGDRRGGEELEAFLKPFVYRRYLDFRALGELRELKRMISQELARKGDTQNVKLGRGGIREIEFIGQAFQLIRGGREKTLQCHGIQDVLDALGTLGLLPLDTVIQLKTHYRTLRLIENRLQEYRDQQTHTLPKSETPQIALAHALGYKCYEAFLDALTHVQNEVHTVFQDVIRLDDETSVAPLPLDGASEILRDAMDRLGLSETDELLPPIETFRTGPIMRRLSPRGLTEIRRLLPVLLQTINTRPKRLEILVRLFQVLEAIASRNVYLTLLAENPGARNRLIELLAASPWFATTISQHPLLLDDLLDAQSLATPITRMSLQSELQHKLSEVEASDLEAFMLTLRHYRHSVILRIAAADIGRTLPLPEVSNALTALAETLLKVTLKKAFEVLSERHGTLGTIRDPEAGFAIVAYGKMGGLELGYGSDLDLVFLYEGDATRESDGPRPLTAAEYYARLAQRVLHILNANTPAGILYDTDLRLRPSGHSGLLVSNLQAFADYQMREAWTWEQQALVKARYVAGDPQVGEAFDTIRHRSLSRRRAPQKLAMEIKEMRQKMRDTLEMSLTGQFDLKQGAGGIVDIEFLVQFWVLAWSNAHPRLTEWTDVLRILERLCEEALIPEADMLFLKQAYFTLRGAAHRAQLDERKATADAAAFEPLRVRIQGLWARFLGPADDIEGF